MKTYVNLEVYPDCASGDYIAKLEDCLPDRWTRDKVAEKRVNSFGWACNYCFTYDCDDGTEVVTLFFIEMSGGGLRVSNIMPSKSDRLTYSEYNKILSDFTDSVISRLPDAGKHTVVALSDEVNFEVLLGECGFELLKKFATTANKSSGSCHPSDCEKWFDFIHHVHENDIDFGASQFERYIHEVANWPVDTGCDLVQEYEFARALLKHTPVS